VSGFAPSLNYKAKAVAATADTVWAGGGFTVAIGQAKQRVAAFAATTGQLRPFAAGVDQEVQAITVLPALNKVVLGGRFTTLNGVANRGMGAADATTGAALAWPVNQVVSNAGTNASINSLSNDGTRVYGTGYTFGSGGNFEGTFGADAATGALQWVTAAGATPTARAPVGAVLYSVSHAHDCGMVGASRRATRGRTSGPWPRPPRRPRTVGRTRTAPSPRGAPRRSCTGCRPSTPARTPGRPRGPGRSPAPRSTCCSAGSSPGHGTTQQAWPVRGEGGRAEPVGPIGYDTLRPTLTGVSRGTVRANWTAAWTGTTGS
jgi:hypothetical protein